MFGLGAKKILGIDIGSAGIKVVEVRFQGGKPHLRNYAWMNVSGIGKINDTQSLPDEVLSACLKRVIKEGDFSAKKANLAIPASGGLVTLIEFPASIEGDLDQAIRFEAHKYIPSALEDVVFSWDVVGRKNSGNKIINRKEDQNNKPDPQKKDDGKLEILLVAASKNKVERYEKIIKDAGIELESVELESFSLVRSLVGKDQRNFLIVDIGHRICNIILSEKGIIKVSRNIDVGGRDLTRIISRSMNLDERRSEQVKMTSDFFQESSSVDFPPLEVIAGEIKRILDNHYGKDDRSKLDGVILSGGTAGLKGLAKHFSKIIGVEVFFGNPFGRLVLSEEVKPLSEKIKSNFGVAVGLAIRSEKEK